MKRNVGVAAKSAPILLAGAALVILTAALQEGDAHALLDTDRKLSGLRGGRSLREARQFPVGNCDRLMEDIGDRPKSGSKEHGQLNRLASPALAQKLRRCHARAHDMKSAPIEKCWLTLNPKD
jgi:hypothetical protein